MNGLRTPLVPLNPRHEVTQRIARSMREVERDPMSWWECAHKARPFNPWPYVCAAAVVLLVLVVG